MKKEVGERVLQVRIAAKLNQREFAARLSTGSGRISGIESGANMPSGDFLLRLHNEFGVDLNWLLTGKVDESAVAMTAPPPLPRDEADLLALYRASSEAGRRAIRATSLAVEKSLPAVDTPAGRGKKSA